ncbi:DUF2087 domain-containing protein [Streptomyces sp. NPDC051001]|uniref:DUF2087 domain-containing protein n=1 Tax=Streptomyces sp. NPDC051001 TaxID=3155795 RepID=UPI00343098B9
MTSENLVRLLAEPSRVKVFAAVVLGADTLAEVTAATGLSTKDAALALRRLEDGELLVAGDDRRRQVSYPLLRDLARASGEVARAAGDGPGEASGATDAVVRVFVKDGRLARLPAQWSRKLRVLDHIAEQAFDVGRRYPEREVNDILRRWCDGGATDHVTLRRYLVDLHLLRREDGVYWRRSD